MNEINLNKLKVAANQFYLNIDMDKPLMTDKEYDQLVMEYESNSGKSVKDLVDWDKALTIENLHEEPLVRTVVEDNDFELAIRNHIENEGNLDYYINLKYDGCGVKAIYRKGKLQRIQTTPDAEFGIVRTRTLWNLFPSTLKDETITSLRGELVVDANEYGELARNKANGLANSVHKPEEVSNEAFIRIYKVQFENESKYDFHKQREALSNLPSLYRIRKRPGGLSEPIEYTDLIFSSATHFVPEDTPTSTTVDFGNVSFQVDGVVLYTEKEARAFKFYFTSSAITTVKEVIYNQKQNGSYAAVLLLEPIVLNDKNIQKVTAGSITKLVEEGFGIGAKVKVILANLVIPKIVEVIEPSYDFNFPKCKCGYQMSDSDVYGATLKCGNKEEACIDKVEKWLPEAIRWINEEDLFREAGSTNMYECMLASPEWFFHILHVDRWDPMKKLKEDYDVVHWALDMANLFNSEINDKSFDTFMEMIDEAFHFSDLQYETMEINVKSAFTVIVKLFEIGLPEIKRLNDIPQEEWNLNTNID